MGRECSMHLEKIYAYSVFEGEYEERVCFNYFGVCGRMILKWIFEEWDRALSGLFRLRMRTDDVMFWKRFKLPVSTKRRNFSPDEELLAPQIDSASWRKLLSYEYIKCVKQESNRCHLSKLSKHPMYLQYLCLRELITRSVLWIQNIKSHSHLTYTFANVKNPLLIDIIKSYITHRSEH